MLQKSNSHHHFTFLLLLTAMCCCLAKGTPIAYKKRSNQEDILKNNCGETRDGEKAFYVPNHGFEKCNLDSCPLTERSRFGVDYCFICCWANITG